MNRRYIGIVVAILTTVAMLAYVIVQKETLNALTAIEPWMAILIAAAAVAATTVQSFQFKAAVVIHRYFVPVRESVALTATNTMANYYLPARGGMVVRAAYMKRVYQFPLPEYAALSVLLTAWSIVVAALLGMVGLAILIALNGAVDARALLALTGVGIAAIAGTALAIGLSGTFTAGGKLAEVAAVFRSGASLWFASKPRLIRFLGWTVLLFVAQAARLWLSFGAVGADVNVGSMLVIQAMATVAFVLALTPGNIGVKEGAIVFAASVLGIDPAVALLASLIDRAAALIVTFAIGLANVRFLSRRAAAGSGDTSR